MREITSICFKRIHIGAHGDDVAGHWWFEIGDPLDSRSESFGWWPKTLPVPWPKIFIGVDGELNDGLNGSVPPRDRYHGVHGDERFHSLVEDDDPRTEDQIADCLRAFAFSDTGKWQWFFGIFGQNCHTFQRDAMEHCGLRAPPSVRKAKL